MDRCRAQTHRRFEGDADAGVRPRDLLDRYAQGQEVRTRAAVLLGERQPEQTELAHAPDDVVAELVVAIELLSGGGHHPPRKDPAQLAYDAPLRRQLEIHPPTYYPVRE